MDFNRFKSFFLPCVAMAGMFALSGCTDSDYDFNEIDATMGFGSDGLTLPVNSTDTIKLADVLELDGSDCVVEKSNGDYVFEQTGETVDPVYPEIDKITVSGESKESEIELKVVPIPGGTGFTISAEGDAQTFTYSGDKPAEVKSLSYVGTDATMNLTVTFPSELSSAVSSIGSLTMQLPAYMDISNVTASTACTVSGSTLVFANIPTSRNLTVSANVTGLDFKASDKSLGSVAIAGDKVDMSGTIRVAVTATVNGGAGVTAVDGAMIRSSFTMDNIIIENARGVFDPEINLDDLGSVDITGVPDFLTDGDVWVDLYNPVIELSVFNDMAVGGVISGTITSYKDGVKLKSIDVSDIPVKPSGTTKVCICRRKDGINIAKYDVVRDYADLSELIREIPDRITFSASARADASKESSFKLGTPYTIQPEYSFTAPIMFDQNASIVYKDTLDGWHEDIEDFELAKGSYINLSTTIENRVPAYLNVDVTPIDVDGNAMGSDEISVEVSNSVLASGDGENSTETPLSVDIKQNKDGALSRLDGLVFHVSAKASEDGQKPVTGVTLNARKHFLIARDIKVKFVGTVIGDFN